MCGIAGIIRWDGAPPTAADVHAMCDRLVHRGPDDEGLYVGDGAAIGMRRLSIIDLATGHQPVRNEDGTIWVVFNGEIYNFKELRADLETRGHRFYTTTDTEAIVHLYEEYGADAVHYLRGMFAFAVWDGRRRELLLARDRLGIKPLFYAEIPGGIAFASEVKALLEVPAIDRRLSWPAISHLFTFQDTPATQSIIEQVQKLDAGHRAVMSRSRPLSISRYWDVTFEPTGQSEGELVDELRSLLDEAVALHLRSDVPLGAFLSGGVDSSAVLALMTRQAPGAIKTFSIGFDEGEFNELQYARRMAAECGTDHHELVLTPQGLDIIEQIAWNLDEPFGDSSAIPTYVVSQMASEHVKVVLTGDGGDELFGGYDKYLVEKRERHYDRIPAPVRKALGAVGRAMPDGMTGRRFLSHLAYEGPRRYLDAAMLFSPHEQQQLFTPEAAEAIAGTDPLAPALRALQTPGRSWLSALQYCDLRGYLPLDILVKVDRMTMAHSIEARPVLLDHRLVEFSARVPPEMKIRGKTTKYLFKRAVQGLLPDEIVHRRKQGFGVPLASWFRGPWTSFVRDMLLSDASLSRGIFNARYIEHLLRLNARGRSLDRQLWTLVSFEQWCRTFLDRPVTAPAPARVRSFRGRLPAVATVG
jgi:asparagine synthase (glutamine-hydrolysing)